MTIRPYTQKEIAERERYANAQRKERLDNRMNSIEGVSFTDEEYDVMVAHERRYVEKPVTIEEFYGVEAAQELREFHERTLTDD